MTVQTNKHAKRSNEQGLTLVEVMVGVLLFSMLSAGAFLVVSGQQRSDQTQQRSSTALDNARLVLNTIANQLRVAKAGMPRGVALNIASTIPTTTPRSRNPVQCGSTNSGIVPAIEVIDGGTTGSDRLRIIYPDGGTWGTLVSAVAPTDPMISVRTPGNRPPALAQTEWGMLTNFDQAILFRSLGFGWPCSGVRCLLKVRSNSADGGWFGRSLANIPTGRTLLRARWVEYGVEFMELGSSGIEVATGGELPALAATALTPYSLLDLTQPAALGIEDLQIALGFDLSTDGLLTPENAGAIDADEWVYNVNGENFATFSPDPACELQNLLAVRISVVARTTSRDHAAKTRRPQLENRLEGTVDGYHRIVLTTVVGLRH